MWEVGRAVIVKVIVDSIKKLAELIYHGKRGYKNIEFEQLKEKLESYDLRFGDPVRIIGTYSEFVPFVNMTRIVNLALSSDSLPLPTCGPCKVGSISNVFCGALLAENTKYIHRNTSCIPIFYSQEYSTQSIKMLSHLTGDLIEVEGYISPIPDVWKDLLVTKEFFTFDKGDGIRVPFCVKVHNCEPYGVHFDEFRIDMWSLAHFEGIQLPLTQPEEFSMLNESAPLELLMENAFPSAFQFVFPKVNIYGKHFVDKTSELRSFTSSFPEIYLGVTRLLDEDLFSRLNKNRHKLEYSFDLMFDKLSKDALGIKHFTGTTFKEIDANHRRTFAHKPLNGLIRYWKVHMDRLAKEARPLPRVLGDSILLTTFGHWYGDVMRTTLKGHLLQNELEAGFEYVTDMDGVKIFRKRK